LVIIDSIICGGDDRTVQLTRATESTLSEYLPAQGHRFQHPGRHGLPSLRQKPDDVIHRILVADGFARSTLATIFASQPASRSQTAGIVQIFAAAREGDSQIVNADLRCGNDVGFVFFGQAVQRDCRPVC
jgi:hypothetical protein